MTSEWGPVIGMDVDGVLHPLAPSVSALREMLIEAARVADFDNLSPQEQEDRRITERENLEGVIRWYSLGQFSEADLEARVDAALHRNRLPLPDGETIEAVTGSLRDVAMHARRAGWQNGPFHNPWPFPGQEIAVVPFVIATWTGPWITSLRARGVEVFWSTTWGSSANEFVAPLLGIQAMEAPTDGQGRRRGDRPIVWKQRAARLIYFKLDYPAELRNNEV
jgi:hypothetical protein